MIKNIYLLLFLFPLNVFAQQLTLGTLKCEYKTNPQGIESLHPRLSWQLQSDALGTIQTAYKILVSSDSLSLVSNHADIWDSGKITSSASLQVVFGGKKLDAAKTYYWKVMAWDNHGKASNWSNIASWQMGLISKTDWQGADWIAYDQMPDSAAIVPFYHGKGPKKLGPANDVLPLLRRTFSVKPQVKKATLYICGLGHFELSLNGKKVGDHFLDPGWTKYDKQALYVPFDITSQLLNSDNTLGVTLGNGFYYIPRDKRYRKLTGNFGYPKMICRLVIEYQDGKIDNILSDGNWKTSPSPITFSSIYGGEDYNAGLEQPGWDTNNFNDSQWRKAVKVKGVPELSAQIAEPLKIMQEFTPFSKMQLANGDYVYDLGQNFSGIPQISVKGKRGDTIKIIPAELLNEDGSVNQKASGSPHYYNYILKGDGTETWHPQFTYYGFRYLQITKPTGRGTANLDNPPVLLWVKGLHTSNSAQTVGGFSCSNELFNKTFKLIDWAMKSNMVSVFTDCPHREKLGWLEEAHLVGSSLHYNYDITGLARKCINDMRISQDENGLIPEISPEYVKFDEPFRDSPEWGSNAVILPWYVYQWYGDKEVLVDNYDMIKRYLAYLQTKTQNHLLYQGLGDWYDLGPQPPGVSQLTPKGITASAIYYYDLDIAAKIAMLLGKSADAAGYKKLAVEVKEAYNKTFFNQQTKQYGTGSQAANAMSVFAGLVEPKFKAAVMDNIVQDIRSHGNSLTAGDIGYRYLLRVLDNEGRSDVIYNMNSRADKPGYGYQLARGATALTESWAALPSVSNNHFMLGHLMEWFYSGLAGIRLADDAIAFNHIEIRPEPIGDVAWAKGTYQSPYGEISSSWKKDGSTFNIDVTIPANTAATVFIPAKKQAQIMVNGKSIKQNKSVQFIGYHNGRAEIKTGSGKYQFTAK